MSIIGLVEKVIFNKETQLNARIDTGATMSSIDIKLAHELGFKKKVRQIKVRNAHGRSVRDIVLIQLNISGILIKEEFSLADRSHMRYQVLIGQNILNKGFFLINPKLKN